MTTVTETSRPGTTKPDDERIGLGAPPCERPVRQFEQHKHPRFPSGYCVVCGAEAHQGCKYEEGKEPDHE